MILPDVNVLLYAHVDAFPQHRKARRWWQEVVGGREEVGIPAVVLFGFLRIATNRRVFEEPMHLERALATTEGWFAYPHVNLLVPGARHLTIAFELLRGARGSSDLTTDAQIAALAIENNGTVFSHDSDFARFDGLRRIDPIA